MSANKVEKVTKKSTLRDDILSMDDQKSQIVIINEWGGLNILVKSLSAVQRYDLLNQCMNGDKIDGVKLYIHTAIACSYDPENPDEKIFLKDDFDVLKVKSASAIEQITTVANEINGIGEQEVKVAEKN